MSDNKIELRKANAEINEQLADESVKRALLATTFKDFSVELMKRAILEGHIRGFTFRDFLERNVYAIKYGQEYSLMTSIDYCRKIGMRSGVNGKSAPTFELDENKKVVSCTVTVYRKDGHPGGYTATVYFDEYVSNKPIWKSKPRTMIAKVAEMHALRMACPEELSQSYIEEELERDAVTVPHTIVDDLKEVADEAPTMGRLHDNADSHGKEKDTGEGPQSALDFGVADGNTEGKGGKARRVPRR